MSFEQASIRTQVYQIKVQGWLDMQWSEWFNNMVITPRKEADGSAITYLTGDIDDQASLRGILSKLWDLNLTLISVTQIKGQGDIERKRVS